MVDCIAEIANSGEVPAVSGHGAAAPVPYAGQQPPLHRPDAI
jgi:hypothetical protein